MKLEPVRLDFEGDDWAETCQRQDFNQGYCDGFAQAQARSNEDATYVAGYQTGITARLAARHIETEGWNRFKGQD